MSDIIDLGISVSMCMCLQEKIALFCDGKNLLYKHVCKYLRYVMSLIQKNTKSNMNKSAYLWEMLLNNIFFLNIL